MKFTKRRKILKVMCVAPFVSIFGLNSCGSNSSTDTDSLDNTTSDDTTSSTDQTTQSTWQSGGTDLITVDFPDDSIFDSSNTCSLALTQATTEGPCYFQDSTGEDISLGLTGLPMQLCLKVIDSD